MNFEIKLILRVLGRKHMEGIKAKPTKNRNSIIYNHDL
jgi:hypothetical protein